MSQTCLNCGQVNADWATECGRCGNSFLVRQRLAPATGAMILVVAMLISAFVIYGALGFVFYLFDRFF